MGPFIRTVCDFVAEELIPLLNERAGFPPDTDLVLYEEIKPNMVERIENYNEPLEKVLEELMDGDIIVFQKDERDDMYELPTCRDYFKWVISVQIEILIAAPRNFRLDFSACVRLVKIKSYRSADGVL